MKFLKQLFAQKRLGSASPSGAVAAFYEDLARGAESAPVQKLPRREPSWPADAAVEPAEDDPGTDVAGNPVVLRAASGGCAGCGEVAAALCVEQRAFGPVALCQRCSESGRFLPKVGSQQEKAEGTEAGAVNFKGSLAAASAAAPASGAGKQSEGVVSASGVPVSSSSSEALTPLQDLRDRNGNVVGRLFRREGVDEKCVEVRVASSTETAGAVARVVELETLKREMAALRKELDMQGTATRNAQAQRDAAMDDAQAQRVRADGIKQGEDYLIWQRDQAQGMHEFLAGQVESLKGDVALITAENVRLVARIMELETAAEAAPKRGAGGKFVPRREAGKTGAG